MATSTLGAKSVRLEDDHGGLARSACGPGLEVVLAVVSAPQLPQARALLRCRGPAMDGEGSVVELDGRVRVAVHETLFHPAADADSLAVEDA